MKASPELDKIRSHLDAALALVRQDRWTLGGMRDGKLKVISEVGGGPARAPRIREPAPLARRCLFERKPVAMSSILDPDPDFISRDWEQDWPAILYAPVGLPDSRPVGLLIIGSRTPHWYRQDEIDYVSAIGVTLTSCVSSITGPLGRLRPQERRVAQLLAEGLGPPELAIALGIEETAARTLIRQVLQKLSLKSWREIQDLIPHRPMTSGGLLL